MKFRKALIASAVALGLGAAGVAQAGLIHFDRDGSGGGSNVVMTDVFDWGPGNLLFQNLFPLPAFPDSDPFTVWGQAKLSQFLLNNVNQGGAISGTEFTYQFMAPSAASIVASAGGIELDAHVASPSTGYFRIYASVDDSNDITGGGYGNGSLILSGLIHTGGGTINLDTGGGSVGLLDQKDADNQGGVTTLEISGSLRYTIDVTFRDAGYFLNDITTLDIDMRFSSDNSAPFRNVNPSDAVVGNIPNYGSDSMNDNGDECGPTTQCDLHLESDGRSPFDHTFAPEPGSLALMGLGLGVLGAWTRRKLKRA